MIFKEFSPANQNVQNPLKNLTVGGFGRSLSYSLQMDLQLPLLVGSATAIASAMLQKRLLKK
ncbi:hypothetical protein [Microcoleus sp. F4-D5]|uniref:hypothetical protein n=1 Tax=Microcoleus sp. F4-D5 TaxID=2818760 RepID=UPI002FD643C0